MTDDSKCHEHRLATYGTLAPGKPNHHVLQDLAGTWTRGWVFGKLKDAGWGAAQGCPGIELDPNGDKVEVYVFESNDLPYHWSRLDRFEGDEYRRQSVLVSSETRQFEAYIYSLAD